MSLPGGAYAYDQHGWESWAVHSAVAAAGVQSAQGSRYQPWVAAVTCAAFIGLEATQRGGAFNDLDSNMDWALPCAVSSGIAVSPFGLAFYRAF